MNRIFIPYVKDQPAAIDIKGHRVLLVSVDEEELLLELPELGGDSVVEMPVSGGALDQTDALAKLAASAHCGIVLTPKGVGVTNMIRNLEHSLPWMH